MIKEPMLCEYSTAEALPNTALYLQPKLNGIRAWYSPATQTLYTRGGNVITSCPVLVQELRELNMPVDGEIWHKDFSLEEIRQAVQRLTPSDDSIQLQLHVFDLNTPNKQDERFWQLSNIPESAHIKKVDTIKADKSQAHCIYRNCLAEGYEGMIARSMDNIYTPAKRVIWKIKPYWD